MMSPLDIAPRSANCRSPKIFAPRAQSFQTPPRARAPPKIEPEEIA